MTSTHVFPCSFQQQRFWLLDQMNPGAAAYTVPMALRLSGPLDQQHLRDALGVVVARHEALRTVFALQEGAPVQVVHGAGAGSLPVIQLPGPGRDARESALRDRLLADANRPFDLAAGPLIRAVLYQLAPDDHVLSVTLHHIVCDGWSAGILLSEVSAAYAALASGDAPDLPPLTLQYPDFSEWQRRTASSGRITRQLGWWTERLRALPALDLPTDHPRQATRTSQGRKEQGRIAPDLAERVRVLARANGATPFVTLLAAWQVLLSRWCGQDDVVVGSITSGRHRAETQPLIGLFVNTLAIRADLSGSPTFGAFLAQIRETVLGALDHQDVPFEMVVEAVQPDWDRSLSPVFQAAFQLLDGFEAEMTLPGVSVTRLPAAKDSTKFELTLMVHAAPEGGYRLVIEYSTELFDLATIQRMLAQYATLLESIAQDPDRPVHLLRLLPASEEQLVRAEWNATTAPFPADRLLHECFETQADRTPEAVALEWDGGTMTFGELDRRANRLAHRLVALGISQDVPVGIWAQRSPELVVAMLAALKSGGYYVPLDPDYPRDRLAYMVEQARIGVLLVEEPVPETLPASSAVVVAVGGDDGPPADESRPSRRSVPGDLAYVMYTSGSTGRPKGVMIPHRAVVNYIHWMQSAYPVSGADAILQKAPASFDACVWEFYLPLLTGARLVLARVGGQQDPHYLAEAVDRHCVTVLQLVPSQLLLMLEAGTLAPCRGLKRVFCGGETLPGELLGRLAAALPGAAVTNLYGPTEATVYATHWTLDRAEFDGTAPIGRPIANDRVYIVNRAGMLAPIGVPGELWIGGVGVGRGYLKQPELTAEKFTADPFLPGTAERVYRTGDLARWRANGTLEYLGRLDHQVKLRGFRIELAEIEATLAGHPEVQGVVAIVREDVTGDKRLVAYVVAAPAGRPSPEALRDLVAARLPEYMVPSTIVFLEAFPLSPNGKVDRKSLPAPDHRESTAATTAPPRTPLEATIARAMEEVLHRGSVGAHDNFFRMGGHSLLAMRLLGRLRSTVFPALTLQSVFEHPTAAGLAEVITASGGASAGDGPIPRRADPTTAPLSFAQEPLWVQSEMEPGLPAYNIPVARWLRGPLDEAALGLAIDRVVARHEALRTRLEVRDGETVQRILGAEAGVLQRTDLRSEADPEPAALSRARTLAAEAFDLTSEPLFRASLLRTAEERHLLLLVTHHIVADGWTLGIIGNEIAMEYDAAVAGTHATMPALPIQFGDFAAWQREQLSAPRLNALLEWWTHRLSSLPTALEIPTDRPRLISGTGHGAESVRMLPPVVLLALKRASEAQEATLFMTLLAAWQTLLHRYTGQSDIVVATPVAGRIRPETEGVVGYFANTLLMRTRFEDDPNFVTLLGAVKTTCIEAFSREEIPFEHLVRALRERGESGSMFQAMFILQNNPPATHPFGGLELEPLKVHSGTAKAELSLSMTEFPDGLRATIEYRTDLFDAATIERMQGHLAMLLDGIVAEPGLPVSRLPILPESERRTLLTEWNRTAAEYPRDLTLPELIRRVAAANPRAIAVEAGSTRMTFAELDTAADRLGAWLQEQGIDAGSLIGVYMTRRPELVVALLAILRIGAAYVPIDPSYPPARISWMLEDSKAPLVLTQPSSAERLSIGARIVTLDAAGWPTEALAPAAWLAPLERASPAGLAYVIYTSGSTGRPKGAMIHHQGLVNYLWWAVEAYEAAAGEGAPVHSSIAFDLTVTSLFVPLLAGRPALLLPDDEGIEALAECLRSRRNLSLVKLTPAHLDALRHLLAPNNVSGRTRRFIIGGENLLGESLRFWQEHAPETIHVNEYGPTETVVGCCVKSVTAAESIPGSVGIGRPIANTRLYVLDQHQEPVPIGVPGELYVGGDGVGLGYLNQPERTAESFVPDPFAPTPGKRLYRTGDQVRYLADGNLEYLGRLDDQVKLRGFRIELGEVDAALLAFPGVAAAAALVREDVPGDRRLVGYVVPRDGTTPDGASLREHLRGRLPEFMVPGAIVQLDRLPLTPNGKLDRKALPIPPNADPEGMAGPAPRNPVEAAIARVWCEVLKRPTVGINRSFFDLGGHSLLVTQVVGRLSKVFRMRIPLRTFFSGPTIGDLAVALIRLEPKPGQVETIARILEQIEQMPEEERRARPVTALPSEPVRQT